jgi:PilZ domain-containing protein
MGMLQQQASPSRRLNLRVKTRDGVWVYWRCHGRDDTSRVRDLSMGGLFVETATSRQVDSTAEVDFLVQEGKIRVAAVVRHAETGRGLGLKFTAINDAGRPRLTELINRLREQSGGQRRLSRDGVTSLGPIGLV